MDRISRTLVADRWFFLLNGIVSASALALLGYILRLRDVRAPSSALDWMPAMNAAMNSISACCLVGAFVAIRRGRREIHQSLNLSALIASTLFLVGYLVYHFVHGDTKYVGAGRSIYLVILGSHVLLSAVVFPMILTSFYFAARGDFVRHRSLSRWTFPFWLYVSVTGVAIFFLLRWQP